jgi:ATP-dependent RNA helicase RhlE
MKFDSLKLIDPILNAVKAEGYETPTPIQAQAIPLILAQKDVLACAQTGTGKTAAFALPILQLLNDVKPRIPGQRNIRVLVLTPTRELASQIADNFTAYGKELPFRTAVIFGGVNQKSQVKALRQGIDILVATPGRLLDLMQQRLVHFQGLEILVLDEADRMLDMGFIHDVRRIISGIPKTRQTLFFSATMPAEIRKLSEQILSKPVRIEVTPVSSTAEKIQQSIYHVEKRQKTSLLIHLLADPKVERALVFTRTKRDANRVSEALNGAGIRSNAIHGNKSQGARERALESIKRGESRILVATDIAARGIDIDKVTHVFNHDIPNISESYVHRIGRTARGGSEGSAFSFCSSEERSYLADIERLIRMRISVLPTPEGLPAESKSKNGPPRGRPPRSVRAQRSERPSHAKSGRGHSKPGFGQSSSRTAQPSRSIQQRPTQAAKSSNGLGVVIREGDSRRPNPAPSPNNRKKRREQARSNPLPRGKELFFSLGDQ